MSLITEKKRLTLLWQKEVDKSIFFANAYIEKLYS